MFSTSMKWRVSVGADSILDTFPKHEHYDALIAQWPSSLHHMVPYTIDGSPVFFEALGRAFPRLIDQFGFDTLIKFQIYSLEKVQKIYFDLTEKIGYFPGIIIVQDLADVGWNCFSQITLKYLQETAIVSQNNYPGTLRKAFVINTPPVVHIFWRASKTWIGPHTLAKIEFLSGGPEIYRDILQNIMSVDDIPIRLGGNSEKDIPTIAGVNSDSSEAVTVPAGGFFKKEIQAEKGDTISWMFETQHYDISFGIFFSEKNVLDMTKYTSHTSMVTGSLVVEEEGTYVLHWDNSYSWTRGKELKFVVLLNSVSKNDT